MKDIVELMKRVFGSKRPVDNGLEVFAPYVDHNHGLPKSVPDSAPPTSKELRNMKKKDRLSDLEKEIKELREQYGIQAELLEKLMRELGTLHRDIMHLLPEK